MFSYFGRVIDKCKLLIDNRVVSLIFFKQTSNKIAPYIVKSTCSIAERVWTINDTHPEFVDVLMNDLRY